MRILLFFLLLILIYLFQQNIYLKKCFEKVAAKAEFESKGVFEKDETDIVITVSNDKLMPLWWLGISYLANESFLFESDEGFVAGENHRKDLAFIMSYEIFRKKYRVKANKRGYYTLHDFELSSGDIFAEYKEIKKFSVESCIYVYPGIISEDEFNISLKKLNGDIISKRQIIEDPFEFKGIREYSPFDSMKQVNWKATARTGELKVNNYFSTNSGKITIMINMEKFNQWDLDENIEESIRIAATLSTKYIKEGIEVEVLTNGCDRVSQEKVEISVGKSINKIFYIYEALARLDIKNMSLNTEDFIDDAVKFSRLESNIIFISHYYNDKIAEKINLLKYKGFQIKWIVPDFDIKNIKLENVEDLYAWEVKML
ncbi:DUF58 domain-containing protein [Clostridium sp. 19966]|uniref:DUF58 domain-containing protein n=1 Tax=Clostridium sp. 19966 TaxID=2768166 RepID=UPI0028E081DA|nr:DUF58 domain-containing protein [Clostridium sp. 19966]MDT8718529.1 DUF58 domain-containing protein [Clostridium sp. 19966]